MKKLMRLWDIVFMNLTAILGLRWLPIAASYGASSTMLWVLAAMLFFIPMGLVACELASAWPEQGGLYVWTKNAYGEKTAFLVAWFYWINSFFFVPSLLTFIAVTLAFVFEPNFANNKFFICTIILSCLWLVVLLNIKGMHALKWLSNLCGLFGTLLPGIAIIFFGFGAVLIWKQHIPTDYSLANWWPNLGAKSNIAFLSTLMFAMAGIELTPILAGETENPHKTFPRATWITAALIVTIYVIGTMSVTFMISPDKVMAASGIMDALHVIATKLNIPFIIAVVALLIAGGNFGSISVWIVVPLKMFLESTKEGVMPAYFTKLNKNYMPKNALLIQAGVMTVIILGTSLLPSVNVFYETLVLITSITYFVPYLFLFMNFLRLRKLYPHRERPYRVSGGKFVAQLIAILGFTSVLLAIVLPFIMPPRDITTFRDIFFYRTEMGGGLILFLAIGYIIYFRYQKSKTRSVIGR